MNFEIVKIYIYWRLYVMSVNSKQFYSPLTDSGRTQSYIALDFYLQRSNKQISAEIFFEFQKISFNEFPRYFFSKKLTPTVFTSSGEIFLNYVT